MKRVRMFCGVMAMAVASVSGMAWGQAGVPAAPGGAAAAASPAVEKASKEQLEALVAPIALYPDAVIAQVLMASTYPVEVVQAARWTKANKDTPAAEMEKKLATATWDESVKALVKVPQVLDMMDQQLDWTTSLGDAFIDDQKAVMDAVQRLRAKAQKEGNLQSNEQQVVKAEAAPVNQTVVVQGAEAPPAQVIVIESKNPEVVYVPTYNPAVVYGSWPYPTYPPPPPYYPPGYVATGIISFGVGVAVGAAWNNNWGNCNWGGGDININRGDININRGNNNINTGNINTGNIGSGNRPTQNNTTFQHDPAHRKGAAYKNPATANKYATPQSREAAAARQDFRGKADTGRQQMNQAAPNSYLPSGNRPSAQPSTPGGGNRPSAQPSTPGGGNRPSAQPSTPGGNRPSAQPSTPGGGNRAAPSAQPRSSGSALSGSSKSGSQVRQSSNRGQASRSASPSRSGGGGGSRGGGGGSRGGGGRR